MENKPMQIGDEKFVALMKEVSDVFRKYNPPLEVAITGIFYVVSEVGQRNHMPKEALQAGLSQIYDNVALMLEKEKELSQGNQETQNEIQH